MPRKVFRTHAGTTALAVDDRRGLEAANALMRVSQTEDVRVQVEPIGVLPQQERDKLERARIRAASRVPHIVQPILNSAADRVHVEPMGAIAAIRARSAK